MIIPWSDGVLTGNTPSGTSLEPVLVVHSSDTESEKVNFIVSPHLVTKF